MGERAARADLLNANRPKHWLMKEYHETLTFDHILTLPAQSCAW